MYACGGDTNTAILRLLLSFGVDLEVRDRRQHTALHHAEKIEVLQALIFEHGANMFAVDEDGNTPFDSACIWSHRNRSIY